MGKEIITSNFRVYFDDEGRCIAGETEAYEKDSKESQLKAVKELAKLPFAYQEKRLANVNPDYYKNQAGVARLFMQIQDYVSDFENKKKAGVNLYLWSHMCGSGKTMMACAIANEIILKGYTVVFMTPGQMITRLQSTFHGKEEASMEDILGGFQKCDLLVFDDLGTENRTQWTDNIIYEVVNGRYLNHKPVLFTSNLSPKELPYKRIADRIKENLIEIHWVEEGTRSAIGKMNELRRNKGYEQMSFADGR